MKITIERILVIALSILAVLFLFRKCEIEKDFNSFKEESELKFIENNAKLIDAEKRIYQGDVVITENSKRIQELVDSLDYVKKIKSIIRVVTDTKIDTLEIPFEVPVEKEIDGSIYIKTPQPFLKIDKWYTISGTVRNTGVFFDSLSYRNEFLITTGTEDHGSFIKNLLKTNRPTVTLRDNNPYSTTKTLHQTVINSPKKRFHFGPQAGAYLIDGKIKYSVGFGATYSLISF